LSRLFFLYYIGHPRYLPPFPTRRSSDLPVFRYSLRPGRCCPPSQETLKSRSARQVDSDTHFDKAAENFSYRVVQIPRATPIPAPDRKSTRLNSSHQIISYAVFCLKKKIN